MLCPLIVSQDDGIHWIINDHSKINFLCLSNQWRVIASTIIKPQLRAVARSAFSIQLVIASLLLDQVVSTVDAGLQVDNSTDSSAVCSSASEIVDWAWSADVVDHFVVASAG